MLQTCGEFSGVAGGRGWGEIGTWQIGTWQMRMERRVGIARAGGEQGETKRAARGARGPCGLCCCSGRCFLVLATGDETGDEGVEVFGADGVVGVVGGVEGIAGDVGKAEGIDDGERGLCGPCRVVNGRTSRKCK